MKKLLSSISVLVVLGAVIFVRCGDNETPPDYQPANSFVGTWFGQVEDEEGNVIDFDIFKLKVENDNVAEVFLFGEDDPLWESTEFNLIDDDSLVIEMKTLEETPESFSVKMKFDAEFGHIKCEVSSDQNSYYFTFYPQLKVETVTGSYTGTVDAMDFACIEACAGDENCGDDCVQAGATESAFELSISSSEAMAVINYGTGEYILQHGEWLATHKHVYIDFIYDAAADISFHFAGEFDKATESIAGKWQIYHGSNMINQFDFTFTVSK